MGSAVSSATAHYEDTARYGLTCWWEDGYRRCAKRCLEGCRRRPKCRRSRPVQSPRWQDDAQLLEIHVSIPEWVTGLGGLSILGCFVALVLHAIKRHRNLHISAQLARRADTLEGEAAELRAEALRRKYDV
jgi:hypothetical protein